MTKPLTITIEPTALARHQQLHKELRNVCRSSGAAAPFPGPHEPLGLKDAAAQHPAAQHLGVTDPVTAAVLAQLPELGELRPFTTNGVRWTTIGRVVVWGEGQDARRTEHDHLFARQLTRSGGAWLEHLGDQDHTGDQAQTYYSAAQALFALHDPLEALYPELKLLEFTPVNDLSPFVRGGFRRRRFYGALLPGADASVRAAAAQFISAAGPSRIGKAGLLIDAAQILIRCGNLSAAAELLNCAAQRCKQSGWISDVTYADLRVMLAAGRFQPLTHETIMDSLAMLQDLLTRMDLWALNLNEVQEAIEDRLYIHAEALLSKLPVDCVAEATEQRLNAIGLNYGTLPLAAVPAGREMTITWNGRRYEITGAATSRELDDEGRRLWHCVGSSGYVTGAVNGTRQLYFIRPEGLDLDSTGGLTAEIQGDQVIQIRGYQNRFPSGEELEIIGLWLHAAGLRSSDFSAVDRPFTRTEVTSPQQARLRELLSAEDHALTLSIQESSRVEVLAQWNLSEADAAAHEAQTRRQLLGLTEQLQRLLQAPPLNPDRYPRQGERYLVQGHWALGGQTLPGEATLRYDAQRDQLHLSGTEVTIITEDLVWTQELTITRSWYGQRQENIQEIPGLDILLAAAGHTGPAPRTTAGLLNVLRGAGDLSVTVTRPGTAQPAAALSAVPQARSA